MILELLRYLQLDLNFLNVFNYITFRAVLAIITALGFSLFFGSLFIKIMGEYSLSQYVRQYGPDHQKKTGTPTMGGLLIIISIVASVLLLGDLKNSYLWQLLFILIGFGFIGFLDDLKKIKEKNSKACRQELNICLNQSLHLLLFIFY